LKTLPAKWTADLIPFAGPP